MKTIKSLKNLSLADLVVHEDQDYLIVNKPPFVSTLADRSSHLNMLDLARSHHEEAQVCHRLDKDTSGILVISKHNEAYKHFSAILTQREVQKLYHALIPGRHELDEEVDIPLFTTSNRSRVDHMQGKQALTFIKTLHIYKAHTLVACMPFTGRMHQIRVHLAHLGVPICGDEMYGGKPIFLSEVKKNYKIGKYEEEQPLMKRMALHAEGITFINAKGAEIKVHAAHNKDFEVVLKQLKKNE